MSLYSLAAGLFEDINEARTSGLASSAPKNYSAPVLAGREGHQRLSRRRGKGQDGKEAEDELLQNGCRRWVDLSGLTPPKGEEDARTPTIELLESCLNDVHRVGEKCITAIFHADTTGTCSVFRHFSKTGTVMLPTSTLPKHKVKKTPTFVSPAKGGHFRTADFSGLISN